MRRSQTWRRSFASESIMRITPAKWVVNLRLCLSSSISFLRRSIALAAILSCRPSANKSISRPSWWLSSASRAETSRGQTALDHVFGYCCGIDVTARDWQKGKPGGQWLLGKTFDTFAPIGPMIVTADEISNPARTGYSIATQWTDHAILQHEPIDFSD